MEPVFAIPTEDTILEREMKQYQQDTARQVHAGGVACIESGLLRLLCEQTQVVAAARLKVAKKRAEGSEGKSPRRQGRRRKG